MLAKEFGDALRSGVSFYKFFMNYLDLSKPR